MYEYKNLNKNYLAKLFFIIFKIHLIISKYKQTNLINKKYYL